MNIAVYPGSFNPLHKGHEAIMRFLTQDRDFDWVYLIVSPQNPFKDGSNNLTGRARYAAAVEAVKRHPDINVWVDDIELGMEPPHYTIRTLDALRAREPDNDFTLVIGADNLESFPRWKDYRRILREYGVVVFPRKGWHRGHLKARLLREDPAYKIELLHAPPVTVSSTEIREALAAGHDVSKKIM